MKKSNLTRGASVGLVYLYTMIVITILLVMTSCNCTKNVDWYNDIRNPENAEYVFEVASDNNVTLEEVTQDMFNKRYGSK